MLLGPSAHSALGVLDERHAQPVRHRHQIERRAAKGHAEVTLARALRLDRPAGHPLELLRGHVETRQDHACSLRYHRYVTSSAERQRRAAPAGCDHRHRGQRAGRRHAESVLADDFVYTHSNGRSQSKPDFIDAIAGRDQPPRRVLSEIEAELHGDVAVTRGNLDIEYADDRPNLYMRYVRVYRLSNHHWLPISHRTVYATDRKPSANQPTSSGRSVAGWPGGAHQRVVGVAGGDGHVDESGAGQQRVELGGGELFAARAEHHDREERGRERSVAGVVQQHLVQIDASAGGQGGESSAQPALRAGLASQS